ncbi:protein of unknown function [Cupriavidus taiwanensis]|uniref:Uncharacterized protein n=1 Tax=Cupriavidus taiwanensis TaxID=164546 RepID=A0A375IHU0_9BURK|nr:hypothetical protein CBM2588_A60446 [Cupriavidus taiwanensis]SOY57333.1 hypothetical protein CBM2592_A90541 [Cupriavidus taiwanensis]SOY79340.1 hypothetical protein CBM2591_A100232 [Cupriavidus taiwanensis]SOZ26214.1 hypothetical protein CBM2608_A70131 [Cupriavidus taiwanensis]SOZ65248.1 hypothetical protein CBM2617_A90134 [Cupriavidus taiwanensis]
MAGSGLASGRGRARSASSSPCRWTRPVRRDSGHSQQAPRNFSFEFHMDVAGLKNLL